MLCAWSPCLVEQDFSRKGFFHWVSQEAGSQALRHRLVESLGGSANVHTAHPFLTALMINTGILRNSQFTSVFGAFNAEDFHARMWLDSKSQNLWILPESYRQGPWDRTMGYSSSPACPGLLRFSHLRCSQPFIRRHQETQGSGLLFTAD